MLPTGMKRHLPPLAWGLWDAAWLACWQARKRPGLLPRRTGFLARAVLAHRSRERFVATLTGVDRARAARLLARGERLSRRLAPPDAFRPEAGTLAGPDQALLAAVTHALAPASVLETGTGTGTSTALLAGAVAGADGYGWGQVLSLDLPGGGGGRGADGVPYRLEVGSRIPERLRPLVRLIPRPSPEALPDVLPETAPLDLAFLDGDHAPECQEAEARLIWPFLRAGGALLCDDVTEGFFRFASLINKRPAVCGFFAGLRKEHP